MLLDDLPWCHHMKFINKKPFLVTVCNTKAVTLFIIITAITIKSTKYCDASDSGGGEI